MIAFKNQRVRNAIVGCISGEWQPAADFFPYCGIEGWGAAVAVGVGAAAGIASSEISASAQRSAANKAADSQKNANQLNYQMFQQAHGSNGNAVLPWYLNSTNGSGSFEQQLGGDLTKAYGDTAMPLSTFQSATGRLKPAQDASVDFTNNLFNGGVTKTLLNNAAPVQAARMATARSSSLDALHKTLDQIDASQASRGYVGDSYGNRLLSFQAGKTAGDAIGAANLANAQQTADIRNYGDVTLPLNNITLPYTQAQASGQAAFMPNDLYLQSIGQRMQPFNMLKIGYTGPFQYQPLPTPGPGAFSGGANMLGSLGGAASGLGGAAMQYYMRQNPGGGGGGYYPTSDNGLIPGYGPTNVNDGMDLMGNPVGSAASTGVPADLYGYGVANGAAAGGTDAFAGAASALTE